MQIQSFFKKALTVTFMSSLLLSPFDSTNFAKANEYDATKILSSLDESQKAALFKLETSEQKGIQLDASVNLNEDRLTDVIVEFRQQPVKTEILVEKEKGRKISLNEAKLRVDATHEQFKKDISSIFKQHKNKEDLVIKKAYKNAFNGVSMSIPANKIEDLLTSNVVKSVWSDHEVKLDLPKVKEDSPAFTQQSNNLTMLHEKGMTGQGVKVGVIDTGIDYNHPDLKEAYRGGYDFVNDDNDPMEATYQDWKATKLPEFTQNGNAYYTVHGTHVAGIIVGNGKNDSEYAKIGVAPKAELYGYRVLGPYGSGHSSDIIAAIDQAITDKMDIINLSLGNSVNDPSYPTSIAINHAVLAGVTAVVAAGNSGSNMKTLGSPGTSTLALTVGANNESITVPTYNGSVEGAADIHLRLLSKNITDQLSTFENWALPLVDVGLGQNVDYTGKDVRGKAVLIERGVTSFDAKIKLAKSKGAIAAFLSNNNENEGHIPYYLGETAHYVPTFSLTKSDGAALKDKIINGNPTITLKNPGEYILKGGYLAEFSSRGPSRIQHEIKPEVTAPGEGIRSTVPTYAHGESYLGNYKYAYQRLSGTSMASPYVAGAAALLLQMNPHMQPEEIKSILMNTADPLSKSYSVFEAGSGKVDVSEALESKVKIMVDNPSFTYVEGVENRLQSKSGALYGSELKTGNNLSETRAITIENLDNRPKNFEVSVAFQVGERGSKDPIANGVTLTVDKKLTVPGNQNRLLDVTITVPGTAEPGTYEGFVNINNKHTKEEGYQIPFAFVVTEEGFYEMKTDPKVLSSNYGIYYPFVPYETGVSYIAKSTMETIDFILLDGKTDKEIGFLGRLNTSSLLEDTSYYVNGVFKRSYYPFTGDPNSPISTTRVPVPYGPAHYKVKMIGTNKEGRTFSLEDHTMIDITGPAFHTDLPEGIVEYAPGTGHYPIKGSVIDKDYLEFQAQNIPGFDQSKNFIMEKNNSSTFTAGIQTDANGNFSYNIPISKTLKSTNVELTGYNSAGIGRESKYFTFIEQGQPYVFGKLKDKRLKMGKETTITLTANNLKNTKGLTTSFAFNKNLLEIVSVKPHEALTELGKDNFELTTQAVPSGVNDTKLSINLNVFNQGLSGDTPIVDITVKAKDMTYDQFAPIKNAVSSFKDEEGVTQSMTSVFYPIWIAPTFSKVTGTVSPPSSLQSDSNGNWRRDIDTSQLGATITVGDQDGNNYSRSLERFAKINVDKLPVTLDQFEMMLDIPGHFTLLNSFYVGYQDDDGELIGHWNPEVNMGRATPGDVTKDHVIDILDAIQLERDWGTSERSSDINFDKIVDGKDMKYIQDNYLRKNPDFKNAPEPKSVHEGKTIEDIVKGLGLE
ncbi:hypothetical protein AWM68_14620 [Fictibacillus phosphorivorans]|uniref:Peptidase S8 n=1 Tax=Fictibacillus phosphorivorans TaxID=1221500 RepID=A0A165N254_9BACL|nr:S8 family serine peptidase [Fictibacillus phosphorivorans]KZE64317.1 hypothetical protein AWM68_14620 [Fictibacillus phosphorivorans]